MFCVGCRMEGGDPGSGLPSYWEVCGLPEAHMHHPRLEEVVVRGVFWLSGKTENTDVGLRVSAGVPVALGL